MKEAIIEEDGAIKCPICGKKTGELTGNEVVKNFIVQCPRKFKGKAHRFVINLQSE